jgi:uncharacterized delta-60 repeat protein
MARWRRSLAGPLVPARRTPPAPRDPALAESVEPRILYSADALAGLLPAATSLVEPDVVMPSDPSAEQTSMVLPAESIDAADVRASAAAAWSPEPASVAARPTELVFVDPGVPDAQRLVDAIAACRPDAAFHIIELDPTRDGLAQITEALAGQREVAAIHIVSHGDPGAIELNGRRIDAAAIETDAGQFTAWRAALGDQADLLIYGCDVASTPAGIAMLMRLAELTGADVAGSTDPTGSSDAGGDWTLEASIGAIQAGSLFADGDPLGWSGLLPEVVVIGPGMAPALNPTASPAMPSILEGATNPSGLTVAELVVDGSITDGAAAGEAIAITALDTSLGAWQYSTNGGISWLTIDAEKINSSTNELALLLGPTASIRMLPFGDLNGTLSSAITFRAWSMATGATGDYVVITDPGDIALGSDFSADTDIASLTVTAVNDAPTFAPVAGSGKLIVPVGSGSDFGNSLAIQPDGKIVVAGLSSNGSDYDFSLIRLNADGSLDTSFDGDGKLIVPLGSSEDYGQSLSLQPDGKILVAGYSYNGTNYDVSLIRLNVNGSLDTSFDGDGKLIVPVGSGNDYSYTLSVQPDGKILLAGHSLTGTDQDFSLIRLNVDGSLDTSFDVDGKLLMPVGSGDDSGRSLTVQPDGKILVAGVSSNGINNDFSLIRLNADGSLDTSLDGDGKVLVPVGSSEDFGQSLSLQPDGKILVAGFSLNGGNDDFSLIRLNADGSLDTSFDGDGKLIVEVGGSSDYGYSISLQPDGKILVAGASYNGSNYDFSLIRVNADGSLDTTFNGTAANTLGGSVSYTEGAAAVALDTGVAIYDADLAALNNGAGDYSGASITLARSGGANAEDVFSALNNLSFTGGNAVLSGVTIGTVSNAAGTLSITFNNNATQARVDELLSSLAYANASGTPPASVQIGWTFSDGNTSAQGSGGALTAQGTSTVNITAANESPVLNAAASPALPAILENATNPSGITVASLVVDGSITDADGSATEAIAITALDASLGTWQYSTDGGTNWLTIDAAKINSSTNELALLLGPNDKIRMLPFGDLNGTLSSAITFRAWDMSIGSTGDYTVISNPGTSGSAFSAASDTASLTVTAVNDAPTFARAPGTGKLIVPVGSGSDFGNSLAIQPDGKIVVAGLSSNGSDYDFSLVRLNADGSLDTSFDGDGRLIVPVGSTDDYGYSLSLQPDGKILFAGTSFNGSNQDFSLIRLNVDGSLDTSFNGSGKLVLPVGSGGDYGQSVTLQSDGKILVSGYSYNGSNYDFSLVRLNADGSLDTSFDGDGKLIVPVGSTDDVGYSLTVQPDGKILVAGYSFNGTNNDFSLIRLNADGSLDTSFDGDGKLIVPVGASNDAGRSVTVQPDGKIVVAGASYNGSNQDFSLIRLNADGSLDTTFDGDGKLIMQVGSADDVAASVTVQPDGKIVVAGTSSNGITEGFSLVRLNADGSLDTSFGTAGKLIVPVGDSEPMAVSMALQPDGKITITGYSVNGGTNNFSLIRVNADGSLDTTFGSAAANTLGGSVSYTEGAAAVALDAGVAIYDADLAALNNGAGNYSGASITLARSGGANAQDVFSTLGNLSFTGGNAVLSGVTIGTVSNTAGTLSITFNSNATQARVNELLSSLAYANASDAPPASVQIVWTFSDGNSSAQGSGGALTTQGTTTVSITAVNDAPSGTSATLTTTEDTPRVLAAADFGFADANDSPDNALLAVSISTLPTAGSLTLDGTAVTVGQSISVADINAGRLIFTPVANASGIGYASFTFRVQDNGGTANGGVDLDPTAKAITFNVIAANDAPSGASATFTTTEDMPWVFAAADFGFTDSNDSPANALMAVTISSLPTAGSLTLAGTAVTVGQSISIADINAGRLVFTPVTNGTGSTSFTFRVQDNGGTANGGVDLDPTAKTITFNVTPANSAPVITSNGGGASASLSVNENSTSVTQVTATDIDLPAQRLGYSVVGGADAARFVIDTNTGLLSFVSSPRWHLPADANGDNRYEVIVGADDGSLLTTQALAITVTNLPDAPLATAPPTATLLENTSIPMTGLSVSDVDGNLSTVSLRVQHGSLALDLAGGATILAGEQGSSTITLGGNSSQLQAALASLSYRSVRDFHGSDTLQVLATDATGLQSSASTAITITPINHLPEVNAPGSQATLAGMPLEFRVEGNNPIFITDIDDIESTLRVTLTVNGGSLSIATVDGLTLAPPLGVGADSRLIIEGPMRAVNAALATLSFLPADDFFGETRLDLIVRDLTDPASGVDLPSSVPIEVSLPPTFARTPGSPIPVSTPPVMSIPVTSPPGTTTPATSTSVGTTTVTSSPVGTTPVLTPPVGSSSLPAAGTASATDAASGRESAKPGVSAATSASSREDALAPIVPSLITAPGADRSDIAIRLIAPVEITLSAPTDISAARRLESSMTVSTVVRAFESQALVAGVFVVTPDSVSVIGLADDTRNSIDASPQATETRLRSESLEPPRTVADELTLSSLSVQSTAAAVSAGVVWWLVNGGTLLWIVLTYGPLARTFDPLPILARERRDDEDDDGLPDRQDPLDVPTLFDDPNAPSPAHTPVPDNISRQPAAIVESA